MAAPVFKQKIADFLKADNAGYNWSHYIIPGGDTIIKLPGTHNYMRGVLNNTVSPASIDSPLMNLFVLWKSCFQQGSPAAHYYDFDELKDNPVTVSCTGKLQQDMWRVQQFFLQNLKQYQNLSNDKKTGCNYTQFMQNLKDQNVAVNKEMLARIYGWVPFNDYCANASAANSLCKTSSNANDPAINDHDANKCTAEYKDVHKIYRGLEYSYTGNVDKQHNFNPYVQLIHDSKFLGMQGYAFSIDDAVGNMQESGEGLIITVGGKNGLENQNAYDPKSAIIVTMGMPQSGRPIWTKFAACPASDKQCTPNSTIPKSSTNFKLGSIDEFPVRIVIEDSDKKIYQFVLHEGPNEKNNYTIKPSYTDAQGKIIPSVTECKVTDKSGKEVAGWCAAFVSEEYGKQGSPYPQSKTDENDRPVTYVSTNDTLP
jgi:hypothetical protein